MQIRAIRESDATEWLRMRTTLWPAEGHQAEIAEHFRSGGTALLAAVFVAERESGGLGGFIELGMRTYAEGCESSPIPFVEGWYVDADARGTGVGAGLIRRAEQWARDRGHHEIGSDTEIDNEDSIAAHRALGYEEVARIVTFRRAL